MKKPTEENARARSEGLFSGMGQSAAEKREDFLVTFAHLSSTFQYVISKSDHPPGRTDKNLCRCVSVPWLAGIAMCAQSIRRVYAYRCLRHRLKNQNEQCFIMIAILIMIAAHFSFLFLL